jgi:RHS repeat-associated protein
MGRQVFRFRRRVQSGPALTSKRSVRRTLGAIAAVCCVALVCAPARPASAECSIFDDGSATGVYVCDPTPPLCDGCAQEGSNGGKAAFKFTESPASRDMREVVGTIRVKHLPAAWIPGVVLSGASIWKAGRDLADGYLAGGSHINATTIADYGHDNAPSPQDAGPPTPSEAPRNTGPVVDPSTTEASNTDSKDAGVDPVNPWNGEFVINEPDLELPGYGVPFTFVRTYRSRVDYDGPLGFGWDHSYNRRLLPTPGDATCSGGMLYMAGNGQTVRFKEASRTVTVVSPTVSTINVVYQAPPGLHYDLRGLGVSLTLVINNQPTTFTTYSYALKAPDGLTAYFDTDGLMSQLSDATGFGIHEAWESDGNGGHRVKSVTDSVGRVIDFNYTSARLTSIVDEASGLHTRYEYQGRDLFSATRADGRTDRYGYQYAVDGTDSDYVPEGELRASCEALCAPGGSTCGATGVCDDAAAVLKPQCDASCAQCPAACAATCGTYCMYGEGHAACVNGEGPPSPSDGCKKECTDTTCPNRTHDLCEAAWEGNDLDGHDLEGRSPAAICGDCDDRCRDGKLDGEGCNNVIGCITLNAGDPLGALQCLGDLGDDARDAWRGLVTAWELASDATECAVHWVCGLWGGSCGECSFEDTSSAYIHACRHTYQDCCANGEGCDPASCQADVSCHSVCQATFWGNEASVDTCAHNDGKGCPGQVKGQCENQCTHQCAEDCGHACSSGCTDACVAQCGVGGSCEADCAQLDYQGLCRDGCVSGCLEHGRLGGGPHYGRLRDLEHNLITAADANGVAYVRNTYGLDPTKPDFDSVVTQTTGDRTINMYYRDLAGEAARVIVAPPRGSPGWTDVGPGSEWFESVDICPATCAWPTHFPATEWVPWNQNLVLVQRADALGGIGGVKQLATVPPVVLALTPNGAALLGKAITNTGGVPSGLTFQLQVAGVPGLATFMSAATGFSITGPKNVLDVIVKYGQVTVLSDGNNMIHVYPGAPQAIAHLASGHCGTPFRADVNDAGQLQLTPASACDGQLKVSPLATMVDDPKLRAAVDAGDLAAFAAADTFQGSALVPGRFVAEWQPVPGTPGRWEMAPGAEDGSAPSTLLTAAVQALEKGPLFREPSANQLKDGAPIFALHLPEGVRPSDAKLGYAALLDVAVRFSAFETPIMKCPSFGSPGLPRRGTGTNSPGPKPSSATVVIDPYGVHWTFYYDDHGRTIRTVNNSTTSVRSFNYDSQGNLSAIEQPLRDRSCLSYNADGYMVGALQFPVPGAIGPTTPIRTRWQYTTAPVRIQKVFDPRDPTLALMTYDYDPQGRLVSTTDAAGDVTVITPTASGLPQEVRAASGALTRYQYDDAVGLPSSIVRDAEGQSPVVTQFTYDRAGRPTSTTSPLGLQKTWTWDGPKLLGMSSTADGDTSGVSLVTDHARVLSSTTTSGVLSAFAYDAVGYPTRVHAKALDGSAPDRVTCTKYGLTGRLLETIEPGGARVRYAYDGEGRLTSVQAGTWPIAAEEHWDPDCAVATPGPGDFTGGVVRATTYDLDGRPVLIVDSAGDSTSIQYDGFGRAAVITHPTGASERLGYDEIGNVTWHATYALALAGTTYHPPQWGDAGLLEAKQTFFDAMSRPFREDRWHFDDTGHAIGAGIETSTVDYETSARRITVTDPAGWQTVHEVDGAGRPVGRVLPTGDVATVTYADSGRTVSEAWTAPTADGFLSQDVQLNARGAPLAIVTHDTGEPQVLRSWTYDAEGRAKKSLETATGLGWDRAYDAFGELLSENTFADGDDGDELVTYNWDPAGRLLSRSSAIDGPTATTSYAYDILGRATRVESPGDKVETLTYYGASSLVSFRIDPRSVIFKNTYQGGLLTKVDAIPELGDYAPQSLSYGYDALGRMLLATHSGASLSSTADDVVTHLRWDSLGDRISEWNSIAGSGLGVSHTYDGRGLAMQSSLAQIPVARTFDGLGRLVDLKVSSESTPAAHFDYAGLGGPIERRYGNGIGTSFHYDELGRVSSIEDVTSGGATLAQWKWSIPMDGIPRVASFSRGASEQQYSFYMVDAMERVVGERHGATSSPSLDIGARTPSAAANLAVEPYMQDGDWRAYDYDGRANWRERASGDSHLKVEPVADEFDAYVEFGDDTPKYDARGALLMGDGTVFSYDALGNLVSTQRDGANRAYEYDALGRRVRETDQGSHPSPTVLYAYDGPSRAVRITDGKADVILDGDGLDEHLVRIGTSGRLYFHGDRSRSVYMVTNPNGSPAEFYDYTAYGDVTLRGPQGQRLATSAVNNQFGYQGQPFDLDFGLVDMRNRQYDPNWGRFVSPDPLGIAGGSNPYAFVGGAVLNHWDPHGLSSHTNSPYGPHTVQEGAGVDGLVPGSPCDYRDDCETWNPFHIAGLVLGAGADFGGGTFNGASTKRPWDHPSYGHWGFWGVGEMFGSVLGMGIDGLTIGAGGTLIGFGGACIVGTDGLCTVVGVPAIAAGGYLTVKGAQNFQLHTNNFGEGAHDFFREAEEDVAGAHDGPDDSGMTQKEKNALGEGVDVDRMSARTPQGAGMTPSTQKHHVMPQEARSWFEERGVDIDKYTVEMNTWDHEAAHALEYNDKIMERLEKYESDVGRQLTPEEILDFIDANKDEFGIDGPYVPYR